MKFVWCLLTGAFCVRIKHYKVMTLAQNWLVHTYPDIFESATFSEASFYVRRNLNEPTSHWLALVRQFCEGKIIEEKERGNFCMSRTSLHKLADEMRVNPDTSESPNSIWTYNVWKWKYLNPKRKIFEYV